LENKHTAANQQYSCIQQVKKQRIKEKRFDSLSSFHFIFCFQQAKNIYQKLGDRPNILVLIVETI
jgi:hypothetical protein